MGGKSEEKQKKKEVWVLKAFLFTTVLETVAKKGKTALATVLGTPLMVF